MPAPRDVRTPATRGARRRLRRTGALAAAVALGATAALLTGSTAQATPAPTAEPLNYVNMGDSYSAGSGVLPLSEGSYPLCLQSAANFAHTLAAEKGYQLTDVSCGAANTSHYATSQWPGLAPQLDALSADTDLVTMTIGGNDNSTFISAILACGTAGAVTLGHGSPCKTLYGDSFTDRIKTETYQNLVNALNATKAKAPNAQIAISGYPWIMPKTDGCFPQMPIAKGDVPYLRDLQTTLNDTIQQAAKDTGVTYVDQSQVSEGKDACQSSSVRWVEPVLGSTQFVPVHPNERGEAGMGARIADALGLD